MGTDETSSVLEVPSRILFVDDEPLVLRSLKRTTASASNQWLAEFAESGEQALERLAEGGIDVVVTDMQMPRMDGPELLAKVQERFPDVVRIVLSGHADPRQAFRAVPVAHQFLTKPFEPHRLVRTLGRAIELRQLLGNAALRRLVGQDNRLPSAPRTYLRLTQLLSRDDSSLRDVCALIERDPALCARVTQLASSGFFRAPRGITSLFGFVSYLGVDVIKSLVMNAELSTMFDAGAVHAAGFSVEELQRHALAVGNLARRMVTRRERAEDAFIAGLLHELGQLVLAARSPADYARVIREGGPKGQGLRDAELEIFGATHAEVGGYILGIWGLPLDIVDAVLCHHTPNRLAHDSVDVAGAVYLSNVLAHDPEAPVTTGDIDGLDGEFLERLPESTSLPRWRDSAHELLAGARA